MTVMSQYWFDNGLTQNWWQAINWTNANQVMWCHVASPNHNNLTINARVNLYNYVPLGCKGLMLDLTYLFPSKISKHHSPAWWKSASGSIILWHANSVYWTHYRQSGTCNSPTPSHYCDVTRGVTIHRYIDISYRKCQRYAYRIVSACIDIHDISSSGRNQAIKCP